MLDKLRDVGSLDAKTRCIIIGYPLPVQEVVALLAVWPWRGWLVPVVDLDIQREPSPCFLAPDDVEHQIRSFGSREDSKVPLPCLHNEDTKPHDPRSIADIYAKATFVSTDWVLKMKPRSRSFLGFL